MSRRLFVRIDRSAAALSWQFAENGQPEGVVARGDIAELARVAGAVPIVVLIPSEDVFITQIPLPGKNRQRLLNAVPYAVEDQVVDDIDDLHFALSEQSPQGRYWVAAVRKDQMQVWFDTFDSAGIKVEAMVPDVMSLDAGAEHATVVADGERALVRFANSAFSCEVQNLTLLFENAWRTAEPTQPSRIEFYDCGDLGTSILPQARIGDAELHNHACDQGLLALAAKQWNSRNAVNLLHGPYSRREKIGKHLRPWVTPAAVLAVWVLLALGLQVYQYLQLEQRSVQLHGEMVQLYKRAFPSADKVPPAGYVKQQMEQRIERLQQEQGGSDSSFQAMLAKSAPVLSQMNGVTLNAVRYYNGNLDVELDLKQASQLQALTDELSQETGWEVEVQSAATRDEQTQVRLQIKGDSG